MSLKIQELNAKIYNKATGGRDAKNLYFTGGIS